MRKHIIIYAIQIIISIVLFNCGSAANNGDNYGDLLSSPQGLVLTPHEHAGGWGRHDCLICHPLQNIHIENHSTIPVDLNQIRDITVSQGEASCPACHGNNGSLGDLGCTSCHTLGIPGKILFYKKLE